MKGNWRILKVNYFLKGEKAGFKRRKEDIKGENGGYKREGRI